MTSRRICSFSDLFRVDSTWYCHSSFFSLLCEFVSTLLELFWLLDSCRGFLFEFEELKIEESACVDCAAAVGDSKESTSNGGF